MHFYEPIFIICSIFTFGYTLDTITFLFNFTRFVIVYPLAVKNRLRIIIFIDTNIATFGL